MVDPRSPGLYVAPHLQTPWDIESGTGDPTRVNLAATGESTCDLSVRRTASLQARRSDWEVCLSAARPVGAPGTSRRTLGSAPIEVGLDSNRPIGIR